MAELLEFKCIPCKQVFSAKDSDYKIYATDCFDPNIKPNQYGNVTILGSFPELSLGIEYSVKAHMESSAKGLSYRVKSIRRDKPISEHGVKLFLEEILPYQYVVELMREYPNIIDLVVNGRDDEIDVNKLYNIKHERIKVIKRKIRENFMFAQIIDELNGLLDFKTVKALYEEFETVDKIKQHLTDEPYNVMCDITGLGFKSADNLLLQFEKDCNASEKPPIQFKEPLVKSFMRMEASMKHCLDENESEGHTKMNTVKLKLKSKSLTPQCIHRFEEVVKSSGVFVIRNEFISNYETYQAELYVAHKLKETIKNNENLNWDVDVSEYQSNDEFSLTDKQMDAIKNVIKLNVSICNGFAGTGKSMTTKVLVKILQDNDKSITILAPTGRASKVVSAYANYPASTIHKLLYGLQGEKIWSDIVIVDEFSMVDIFLMKWLFSSIDFERTKLLFIGDSAQIMSVGAGNCLHDMLNSGIIPTTTLDKVFRYGVGGVMTVATKTRLSEPFLELKGGSQVIGEDKGYMFHHSNSAETTCTIVKKVYTKLLENNKPEDILILSPYNIGEFGTTVFNEVIHPIANPLSINNQNFIESNKVNLYESDLVIQTKNNYKSSKFINDGFDIYESMQSSKRLSTEETETLISNGDIGKIICISDGFCLIDFDGEKVVYDKGDLFTCRHSYAISIHKSQGGNAKHIIAITAREHARMLNCNLLYVAETRARERIIHIGDVATVNKSILIKAEVNRLTYLKEMLMED